jgi:hypothetical protein
MAVDGDKPAHPHAVQATAEVKDGGAQGIGREGEGAGPALRGPRVAIGDGGEEQCVFEAFGDAAGDTGGKDGVGEQGQMRAVLFDGTDGEDSDETARDASGHVFPAGGSGVEHHANPTMVRAARGATLPSSSAVEAR